MSNNTLSFELLKPIPLFRNMNETELHQLAEISLVTSYAPGEPILKQGAESRDLWVVLEGKCQVLKNFDPKATDSQVVSLAMLEPYSHFGDMSFFHPAPHSATVSARTAVKLLRIKHSDYMGLIEDGVWAAYKLAYNCIDGMAERLRRMDDWVAELMRDEPAPQKSSTAREWSAFRTRLFDQWNL